MMFKDKLKTLIQVNNLSKAELARELGVSQSQITRWLRGETKPSLNSMKEIALFFDIKLEDLV